MPFIPLEEKKAAYREGFIPLEEKNNNEQSYSFDGAIKTIESIGSVYPVAEAAASLATQAVALPVAGLAGLGSIATKAVGLTDIDPADVVNNVAGALTYQPYSDLGQHFTGAVMYPFEKLAEAGRAAGDKTLAVTGSPAAATAIDTAINALPMGLGAVKPKGTLSRAANVAEQHAALQAEALPQHINTEIKQSIQAIPDHQQAANNAHLIPDGETPQIKSTPENLSPTTEIVQSDHIAQPLIETPKQTPINDIRTLSAEAETMPLPQETIMQKPAVESIAQDASNYKFATRDDQYTPDGLATFKQNENINSASIEPLSESTLPFGHKRNYSLNEMVTNQLDDSSISNQMPNTPIDQIRNSWAPGANYKSIGIDKPATGIALADKPIRREDVIIPFIKALDTTLYEGRVKGKNRLGFYIPKLGAVRIKNKSDLEVSAHEIAHLIDDRVPEISQAWKQGENAKIFADELRSVSYDKSKIYEGFAEYIRLKLTQPEQANARAPKFDAWFDDFTNRHQYGPAIKQAQTGMTAWFNQDALHRAQSKIGMQRDLNGALDGVFDKFRQATVDDLHGIYRMERNLKGKVEPLGAYEISRNTRGAAAIVDGAIKYGAPTKKADGSFGFTGHGLEKILEPVAGELEQFLMYSVGRSANELMIQGREKLFTREEIKSMTALEKPEFKKAFSDYQKFNNSVLDFAEAHSVLNPQIRQLFNRQSYIPFYRAGQPGTHNVGGVTGNWSGIKKLTGGDENLRPILGNMIQNTSMLIEASLKNEARLKIVELANNKGGGKFLVRIEADQRPVKIDKSQVKDELLKASGIDPTAARLGNLNAEQVKLVNTIDQSIEQAPGFFEFMLHNQAPSGNVMAVLRNGKPEYYEVADPLLFRAVQSLNRPAQNWVIRLLGMPKRIGQATITLTPDFMVANLARDTIMASIMSKAGFRPAVDSFRGMASRIKSDPIYQEFIANGGGFSSYLRDEHTFRAHLERFYTSKGIDYKTVLDTPDKLLYGLETIADAFEMSSRLGEYKRMREQGAHPRHAAYVAREISTDFAMRGDSRELGFMYDTVMFLRPAVLSWDRMYRGLKHDENRAAIAAKAGTLALMSVGLYLINRDNPEYQDLPDWDKDTAWHFFIPQSDGSSLHLRYPKIWEIGALASISERTTGKLLDDDPKLGGNVADIVRNTFNLNLMPQIISPLYEQATNRNNFTKSPIETPGMDNLQPFLRAKPNTSETLKQLGLATRNMEENLQIPPARAEALLRGYFGTWAMYGLMLSDQALFGKELPARRTDELPVVRRFYEGSPAKHTKYETMFYDLLGEAERLHGTIKALDKSNKEAMADEFSDEPASNHLRRLQRAQRNLQSITKDMNSIKISNNSREDKRIELDALIKERNELLKSTVTDQEMPQKNKGFSPIQ